MDRAVGFDAWVASRSAALTRFAYVLTGSEVVAEQALHAGLGKACLHWSRVRRADDPEWEVRRLVVAAALPARRRPSWPGAHPDVVRRLEPLPPATPMAEDAVQAWQTCAGLAAEQRAAVVLRCYAGSTYPQIATALERKERVAISLVEQSFAALAARIGARRSDGQLDQAFHDAFAMHSDDLADAGGRVVVARAVAGRLRRRRIVRSVTGGAVAACAGVLLVLTNGGTGTDRPAHVAAPHPSGWRPESYDGIQLWVPPSWGWGEVPHRSADRLVSCGFGAYSSTAITTNLRFLRIGSRYPPYVGRPAALGSGCPPMLPPMAAHVWFDSPLPVGSGVEQTTVRVTGVTSFNVTVADPNGTERETIIASIERVAVDANGCPRGPDDFGRLRPRAVADQSPVLVRSVSLCLFAGGNAGDEALYYSTRVLGRTAQEVTASLEEVPGTTTPDVCLVTPAVQYAVLIARSDDAFSVFGVNTGTCTDPANGSGGGSQFHVLTAASVRLWALDGLAIYVSTDGEGIRLTPLIPGL